MRRRAFASSYLIQTASSHTGAKRHETVASRSIAFSFRSLFMPATRSFPPSLVPLHRIRAPRIFVRISTLSTTVLCQKFTGEQCESSDTSSLKNFFNMFFCYLCDRYIFFFSSYNPENCQKLVRMCSSCCTKFR